MRTDTVLTAWNPDCLPLHVQLARIAIEPATVQERAEAVLAVLGQVLPYDAVIALETPNLTAATVRAVRTGLRIPTAGHDHLSADRGARHRPRRGHLSVWHDLEFRGGDPGGRTSWWGSAISDVFLFALSNNGVRSKPCLAELARARVLGLPIVPVRIGPVDHIGTTPVADIQVIDYRERRWPAGWGRSPPSRSPPSRTPQHSDARCPDPLPEQPPFRSSTYFVSARRSVHAPDAG